VIQSVEINSNNDTNFLVASVYLPSKGSHDYIDEFYDCIDQLYEIYQKYQGTHKIIIGGDLNEDLNFEKTNKRKTYLLDLIKECGLSYDNNGKTFIKPNGEECSELDYFLQVGLCSHRIHRHRHGFLLMVDRLKLLRILYHYYY
jgi:hypothetical protein